MTPANRSSRRRAGRAPRNPYGELTDRIIAALKRGTVPWRQPWRAHGLRNALSNRPYRGINLLMLGLAGAEQGYDDPRWLTYRQAEQRGGHVRQGERGTRIALWKRIQRESKETGRVERFPLMRLYTVFNVAQCEKLALSEPATTAVFDPIHRAEALVADYVGGPPIVVNSDAACYLQSPDEVHVPPRSAFRDMDGYHGALFHELVHSTGHPSRLNREGFEAPIPFGSPNYSREELVAEFGAAFLCHEAGIDGSGPEQSAALHRFLAHHTARPRPPDSSRRGRGPTCRRLHPRTQSCGDGRRLGRDPER